MHVFSRLWTIQDLLFNHRDSSLGDRVDGRLQPYVQPVHTATMSPRSTLTAATLTLLLGSASANGLILYGIKANGFKFSPEIVYANVGDILEFHFEQYNHSVVMGDWNTACAPAKTGGFYSGFIPSIEPQSENVRPPNFIPTPQPVYATKIDTHATVDLFPRPHQQH